MYTLDELEKILQEKCTCHLRKSFTEFKGYIFGKQIEEIYDGIYNSPVYKDDIWVCSYPKNGTTWTQEMVWLISNNLDYDRAKVYINLRYAFIDWSTDFDFRDVMKENPDLEVPLAIYDSVKYFQDCIRPRFIKTHLPFDLLPKMIQEGTQKPKMIFVIRNAKDTCISFYHHCLWLEGYKVTFEEFCEMFLVGKVAWGSYWKVVLSYKKHEKSSNILIIKFEDMKNNLKEILKQVSKYLERDLTEEQLDGLAKHLNFDNMRNNPAVNYDFMNTFPSELKASNKKGAFMRSGKTEQYKTEMSPEMIQRFDQKTKVEFKDFPELIY